jgi:succinate dehydrogenase / fumarate reductase cytochrome b subunit
MLQDADPRVHDIEVLRGHSVGIKVWLLHRITGCGLLLYLLAHIATMGTALLLGDAAFRRTFDVLFHTPIFEIFDVLVLAALVIHAMNGLRLIILELGVWVTKRQHKTMLIVTGGIALIVFAWLFTRAFL